MRNFAIGMVGTGSAAKMHFDILGRIPNVVVQSICGRSKERLALRSVEWGVRAYPSIEDMVREERLDIVLIANENFNHAKDASLAIAAGAHVLVEKPLDASLSRARCLLNFANLHKKTLGVVLQKRFDSNIVKLKKLVSTSFFGAISIAKADIFMHRSNEYFDSKYWLKNPHQIGGGILTHHATHMIDALLWILNSEVVSVSGWTSSHIRSMPIEDSGGCWIQFKNGVVASINASVALDAHLKNRIEIFGTSSSAWLTGTSLSYSGTSESLQNINDLSEGNEHEKLWVNYLSAIANSEKPVADAESALKTQIVIDAIYRSAKNSKNIFL